LAVAAGRILAADVIATMTFHRTQHAVALRVATPT